jgi:Beta-lactamase enzyme family
MRPRRILFRAVAATFAGAALIPSPARAAVSRAVMPPAICRSSSHPALAAGIGRDIRAARRGRVSAVAVAVDDAGLGLTCWVNRFWRVDSASVVKVTILGALLRKAEDQHRHLTATEAAWARAMITRSDNDAASALWAELGRGYLRHFLDAAAMRHTSLGPGGYWGLTQVTANDQVVLLRLLLNPNAVIDVAWRAYALSLMAHVIPSQRWGVPAGAPASLTAHIKNGWPPRATHGWRVHSIGCFTGRGGGYSIVVLTQDNPAMAYGVDTIQAIARTIDHDLNPEAAPAVPAGGPARGSGGPAAPGSSSRPARNPASSAPPGSSSPAPGSAPPAAERSASPAGRVADAFTGVPGTPDLTAQVLGLNALALAVVLARTRLSLRRRTNRPGPGA